MYKSALASFDPTLVYRFPTMKLAHCDNCITGKMADGSTAYQNFKAFLEWYGRWESTTKTLKQLRLEFYVIWHLIPTSSKNYKDIYIVGISVSCLTKTTVQYNIVLVMWLPSPEGWGWRVWWPSLPPYQCPGLIHHPQQPPGPHLSWMCPLAVPCEAPHSHPHGGKNTLHVPQLPLPISS